MNALSYAIAAVPGLHVLTLLLSSVQVLAENPWVGKMVLTTRPSVLLQKRPEHPTDNEPLAPVREPVMKVEDVNGNYLKVRSFTDEGWINKTDVVTLDRAIAHFTEMLKKDSRNAFLYQRRADASLANGDYDRAMKDYTQAIDLEPQNGNLWNNRGVIRYVKKEYARALSEFNEAVRLSPNDCPCLNSLAWLLSTCPNAKFRDGKRALQIATRACELSRWKDAGLIDTLAAAHAEVGDFEKAISLQKDALKDPARFGSEGLKSAKARLKLYEMKKAYRDD